MSSGHFGSPEKLTTVADFLAIKDSDSMTFCRLSGRIFTVVDFPVVDGNVDTPIFWPGIQSLRT